MLVRLHVERPEHDELPWVGATLTHGERIERALLAARFDRHEEALSDLHVLSLSLVHELRIDHVLFWIPSGKDDDGWIETISHLNVLRPLHRNDATLTLDVIERGSIADLLDCPRAMAVGIAAYLRPSRIWYSRTPYVVEHDDAAHAHEVAARIQDELQQRQLPAALNVEVIRGAAENVFGFADYHCVLQSEAMSRQMNTPWAVRIEFATEVGGPIALGYGARYGLGVFEGE